MLTRPGFDVAAYLARLRPKMFGIDHVEGLRRGRSR